MRNSSATAIFLLSTGTAVARVSCELLDAPAYCPFDDALLWIFPTSGIVLAGCGAAILYAYSQAFSKESFRKGMYVGRTALSVATVAALASLLVLSNTDIHLSRNCHCEISEFSFSASRTMTVLTIAFVGVLLAYIPLWFASRRHRKLEKQALRFRPTKEIRPAFKN